MKTTDCIDPYTTHKGQKYENNKKNNDNTESCNLRFLQSPHYTTNCLQHIHWSGQGTIVCKSHQALITCNMSFATRYKGTAQLLNLKSHLFQLYFTDSKDYLTKDCQANLPKAKAHLISASWASQRKGGILGSLRLGLNVSWMVEEDLHHLMVACCCCQNQGCKTCKSTNTQHISVSPPPAELHSVLLYSEYNGQSKQKISLIVGS